MSLQLSAKSVGLFEAFYSNMKPIQLVHYEIEVAKPGKFDKGTFEIPFEVPLTPLEGQELFETYHGVYVSVEYYVTAELLRGVMSKNVNKKVEIIVEQKVL